MLKEFGLQLRYFGHRGSTTISNDKILYIKLGTTQWWIEEQSIGGWHTRARDWGVESLRKYLNEHARGYSLLRR